MDKRIQVIQVKGEDIKVEYQSVMRQLEYNSEDIQGEDVKQLYETMLSKVRERIRPSAALSIGTISDTKNMGDLKKDSKVIYAISTLGQPISDLSFFYSKHGNYRKSMMIDAIADALLFSFDKILLEKVKEMCETLQMGVLHRYEAPEGIPMEMQKEAFDVLSASRTLGMSITDNYMYKPLKSLCQIFELTNENVFYAEHDCSNCERKDCASRKKKYVHLKVLGQAQEKKLQAEIGQNLMQVLQDNHIYIDAACGGNGWCGKCQIKLISGKIDVSKSEEKILSKQDIENGIHLACMSKLMEDCDIEIWQQNQEFDVLGIPVDSNIFNANLNVDYEKKVSYDIAIDIGTTTIAMNLLSIDTKKIVGSYTTVNHQKMFGADVIARIQSAESGKTKLLQEIIQKDLIDGIETLIKKQKIKFSDISQIGIAGNTTMLHLLRGYSCDGLGKYPFKPISLSLEEISFEAAFGTEQLSPVGEISHIKVFLLPGNSAFIGADIVSGMYAYEFNQKDEINILIDLGTNGEMAIGNKSKIMVTSAAAGPAFEGGNITWGMGSIEGAISSVIIEDDHAKIKTIHDKMPIGICGTGVIETVAELVRNHLVDEIGNLREDFVYKGFPLGRMQTGKIIYFTQEDIREIQLAKSAIRAGLETLIKRYGVSYDQISKVYLAGGFGYYLNVEQAVQIGMLPEQLREKTISVGNAALKGVVRFLLSDSSGRDKIDELAHCGEEITLALDDTFNALYLENMMYRQKEI